jgi:hypothetical protein
MRHLVGQRNPGVTLRGLRGDRRRASSARESRPTTRYRARLRLCRRAGCPAVALHGHGRGVGSRCAGASATRLPIGGWAERSALLRRGVARAKLFRRSATLLHHARASRRAGVPGAYLECRGPLPVIGRNPAADDPHAFRRQLPVLAERPGGDRRSWCGFRWRAVWRAALHLGFRLADRGAGRSCRSSAADEGIRGQAPVTSLTSSESRAESVRQELMRRSGGRRSTVRWLGSRRCWSPKRPTCRPPPPRWRSDRASRLKSRDADPRGSRGSPRVDPARTKLLSPWLLERGAFTCEERSPRIRRIREIRVPALVEP